MYIVLGISILIVIIVLILTLLTTNKAYSYKHTVDSIENNPNLNSIESSKKERIDDK